jgi:hypothetical protein
VRICVCGYLYVYVRARARVYKIYTIKVTPLLLTASE